MSENIDAEKRDLNDIVTRQTFIKKHHPVKFEGALEMEFLQLHRL